MRVSVYIPSYNQRAYLIEAVESVLAQTRRPDQIIIADDCSTDGSQEVIAEYARRYDGLVTPVYHDRNVGVAQNRVDALSRVTGDVVTYVDGDDLYLPRKIECDLLALESAPDAGIAFCNTSYISPEGRLLWNWIDDTPPPQGDVFVQTFSRAFPRGSLFRMEMVRFDALKEVGFHDPTLRLYEDWDLRIRLTKRIRAVYHDEPLTQVRLHGQGLANSPAPMHIEATRALIAKNLPLLEGLDPETRRQVHRRLGRHLARLSRKAAVQTAAGRRPDASRLGAVQDGLRALWYMRCSRRGVPCVRAPRAGAAAALGRRNGAAHV